MKNDEAALSYPNPSPNLIYTICHGLSFEPGLKPQILGYIEFHGNCAHSHKDGVCSLRIMMCLPSDNFTTRMPSRSPATLAQCSCLPWCKTDTSKSSSALPGLVHHRKLSTTTKKGLPSVFCLDHFPVR